MEFFTLDEIKPEPKPEPKFDYNKHIDYLIDTTKQIKQNEITILTGRNASGKSLVRKLLRASIIEQTGKKKVRIPHASQELRTHSNPELGALCTFAHDLEWLATSHNTIDTIKKVLKTENPDFIILDEPEIGLGEELQMGLINYLNANLKKLPCGVLVITHNKNTVLNLHHDKFLNLEKMTEDEWVNRKIEPLSVKDFKNFSNEFFKVVRDRMNKNKKK